MTAPTRKREAGHSCKARDHHTFGQQQPDHPAAARAK